MDMEEEILAFGETALWVGCDLCGRSFGGPGLNKAIVAVGHVNVCVECLGKRRFSLAIANPSAVLSAVEPSVFLGLRTQGSR
jgi:hypothetical protein